MPTTKKPESKPKTVKSKAYMLRTCDAQMKAHGGFVWPKSGPVECPDWDPTPECGNGLHGLLWGGGDVSLLSSADDAVWQIVEIEEWVEIGQKIKAPRGVVVYSGEMAGAIVGIATRWMDHLEKIKAFEVDTETAASGDSSQLAASGYSSQLAASGDSSQLAASGDSSKLAASGDYSQLAASGDSSKLAASGYYSQLAASGDYSKLAASGDYSQLAASGDYSKLAASGYSSQLAASGDSSQLAASGNYSQLAASGDYSIAVSVGFDSKVAAGADGCIALAWWDQANKRYRLTVGYVGENGIEAKRFYTVDEHGAFVPTDQFIKEDSHAA